VITAFCEGKRKVGLLAPTLKSFANHSGTRTSDWERQQQEKVLTD